MEKPITTKDIARELQVNHTTVSMALRNKKRIANCNPGTVSGQHYTAKNQAKIIP